MRSDIAIALHTAPHRAVSLALVAEAVGAVKRTGLAETKRRFSKAKLLTLMKVKAKAAAVVSAASSFEDMPAPSEHTFTFSKASMETMCGIGLITRAGTSETRISSLDPEGAGADCGLQVGDVLLTINGVPVTSQQQGARMLKSAEGEVKLRITRADRLI